VLVEASFFCALFLDKSGCRESVFAGEIKKRSGHWDCSPSQSVHITL
jgi:hypothetical protein